jgi:hypothetical protein
MILKEKINTVNMIRESRGKEGNNNKEMGRE